MFAPSGDKGTDVITISESEYESKCDLITPPTSQAQLTVISLTFLYRQIITAVIGAYNNMMFMDGFQTGALITGARWKTLQASFSIL